MWYWWEDASLSVCWTAVPTHINNYSMVRGHGGWSQYWVGSWEFVGYISKKRRRMIDAELLALVRRRRTSAAFTVVPLMLSYEEMERWSHEARRRWLQPRAGSCSAAAYLVKSFISLVQCAVSRLSCHLHLR